MRYFIIEIKNSIRFLLKNMNQTFKITNLVDLVKFISYLEEKETIQELSNDILGQIFQMLDTHSRLTCRLVCYRWNQVIRNRIPIVVHKKRYFESNDKKTFKKIFKHPNSDVLENPVITRIRLKNSTLMQHIVNKSFKF